MVLAVQLRDASSEIDNSTLEPQWMVEFDPLTPKYRYLMPAALGVPKWSPIQVLSWANAA